MSTCKTPKKRNLSVKKSKISLKNINRKYVYYNIIITSVIFIIFLIVWLIIGFNLPNDMQALYHSNLTIGASTSIGIVLSLVGITLKAKKSILEFFKRKTSKLLLSIFLSGIFAISLAALMVVGITKFLFIVEPMCSIKKDEDCDIERVQDNIEANADVKILKQNELDNEDTEIYDYNINEFDVVVKHQVKVKELFPNVQTWLIYPYTTRKIEVEFPLNFEEADLYLSDLGINFDLSVAPYDLIINDVTYIESMRRNEIHYGNAIAASINNFPLEDIIEEYENSLIELLVANEASLKHGGYRFEVLYFIGRNAYELGVIYYNNGFYDEAVYCYAIAIESVLHALRICEINEWENTLQRYSMPYMISKIYNHFSYLPTLSYEARYEILSIADYWAEYNINNNGSILNTSLLRAEILVRLSLVTTNKITKGQCLILAELCLSLCLQYYNDITAPSTKRLLSIRIEEIIVYTSAFWYNYPDGLDGMLTIDEINEKYSVYIR